MTNNTPPLPFYYGLSRYAFEKFGTRLETEKMGKKRYPISQAGVIGNSMSPSHVHR